MNKRTSIIWSISDADFQELLNNHSSVVNILKYFGLNPYSGNHKTINERIQSQNYDLTQFHINKKNQKKEFLRKLNTKTRSCPTQLFCENSKADRSSIKRYLLHFNLLQYQCSDCNIQGHYNGKPLSLQLDHINGVNNDNRLENLRWLCPNCHSQTETYAGKKNKCPERFCSDCGKKIHKKSNKCRKCSTISRLSISTTKIIGKPKIDWPTNDELSCLILTKPLSQLAKDLGVSDVAIRKHCNKNSIPLLPQGFWLKGKIPKFIPKGKKTKTYILQNVQTQEYFETDKLSQFAQENGLFLKSLYNLTRKNPKCQQHRGFTCQEKSGASEGSRNPVIRVEV